jgi:hypothetical protein
MILGDPVHKIEGSVGAVMQSVVFCLPSGICWVSQWHTLWYKYSVRYRHSPRQPLMMEGGGGLQNMGC